MLLLFFAASLAAASRAAASFAALAPGFGPGFDGLSGDALFAGGLGLALPDPPPLPNGDAECALAAAAALGGRPSLDGMRGGALPDVCPCSFFLNGGFCGEAARLPLSSGVNYARLDDSKSRQEKGGSEKGRAVGELYSLRRLLDTLSASLSSLARYGDGLARSVPRRALAAAMREAPRRVEPDNPRHDARCGAYRFDVIWVSANLP